jgi:hypothetical protein
MKFEEKKSKSWLKQNEHEDILQKSTTDVFVFKAKKDKNKFQFKSENEKVKFSGTRKYSHNR